ncbi:tRNA1(Val) (adenine(37)-N6)-methyltransferase [Jannaschia sp. M317]|uniref:tRNA1(Val) (adenine(37)-N6)-methyltransferase n=1 Tax=Jannaschia sp. M317 TaxID=2867011 RepID=UPI0021A8CBE0|nr:methyltransferase [Jannaschia sp. M317]UWQ17874.1 methyltransferase [Jannaschia sp. M317]
MTQTRDAFLGGRLVLRQTVTGFRAGSDAVLLAAAVPARAGQSVLDLGCGVGAVMYCLGTRVPGLTLTGLETEPVAAALARANGTAEVAEADVLTLPPDLRNRQWDHVVSNPPYFGASAGSPAHAPAREAGLREARPGDLRRWVEIACKRAAPKGSVTLIARADRLADLVTPMAAALGGLVVQPVAARPGTPAKRVIVQGVKGSRAALRLCAPLNLHAADGSDGYAPEAEEILRNMGPLSLR